MPYSIFNGLQSQTVFALILAKFECVVYICKTKSYEDIVMDGSLLYDPILNPVMRWPNSPYDLKYSCLFIDLYDNYNQGTKWGLNGLPQDTITGYSTSILNSIINQSYSINDVKNLLKANKPSGVNNAMIDEMFNYYNK